MVGNGDSLFLNVLSQLQPCLGHNKQTGFFARVGNMASNLHAVRCGQPIKRYSFAWRHWRISDTSKDVLQRNAS